MQQQHKLFNFMAYGFFVCQYSHAYLKSNKATESDVLARVWVAFNKIYFIAPDRHSTLELSRKNIDSCRATDGKIYATSQN